MVSATVPLMSASSAAIECAAAGEELDSWLLLLLQDAAAISSRGSIRAYFWVFMWSSFIALLVVFPPFLRRVYLILNNSKRRRYVNCYLLLPVLHAGALHLEEAADLSCFNINVNAPERRIRAGSRHQADGASHGAEKFCARVDEHIPYGQYPAHGHPFK